MKRMYVRCGTDDELTCYIFEVETARGKRRVYPPGIGKFDEAATAPLEALRYWFKTLKVTHVVSSFDQDVTAPECIADGTHKVSAYLKWWKLAEEQDY